MMNGVNYQKHKPSGDQNLPLEGVECQAFQHLSLVNLDTDTLPTP